MGVIYIGGRGGASTSDQCTLALKFRMCHLLLFFTTAVTVAKINITCIKIPCDISLLVFFHDNIVKMANINITCLRVTV